MLDAKQLTRARLYLQSISALHQKLESDKAAYIQFPLVEQIDAELSEAIQNLPDLELPKWDREAFFQWEDDDHRYYRRQALGGFLVRVLARLNEAVREVSMPPGTTALAFQFVKNQDVRSILERDYRELQLAVVANAWKGALILAGSCIEGVLFDLATQNKPASLAAASAPREPDITRWMLGQLVAVCTELKLIPPGVDKLSPGLKDYRNLVHPAVEVREKLTPGEHEAQIAVAILNMLHRDLS